MKNHRSLRLTLPLIALVGASGLSSQVRLERAARTHLGLEDASAQMVGLNDIEFVDLDGDGDRDLVVAINRFNAVAGSIAVCLNNGAGVFDAGVRLGSEFSYRTMAVGDIDGDGDADIVGLTGYSTSYVAPQEVEVFENDGSGGFTVVTGRVPANNELLGLAAGLVDLDGDTDLDLVLVAESPSPALRAWENNGSGTFTDRTGDWITSPFAPGYFELVDMDGNGMADIVATDATQTRILLNNGTGALVDGSAHAPTSHTYAVGDFDGDQEPDLLTTGGVYLNDGNASGFSLGASMAWQPWLFADMATGDFDADGRLDILAVTPERTPVLLLQDTPLTFTDASASWIPATLAYRSRGFNYATVAVADVDDDGRPDALVGGAEGRGTSSFTIGVPPKLLLNRQNQEFVDASRRGLPGENRSIEAAAAGDVDGDGDVDIVATDGGWLLGFVGERLLENDGQGMFAEKVGALPVWVSGPDRASCLELVDVDGDGDLDLLEGLGLNEIGPNFPGQNRLALNDGAGGFTDVTATHLPAAVDSTGAIACGDVDGDGDPDLLVGNTSEGFNQFGQQDRLLLNNGSGVFSEAAGRLPTVNDCTGALALVDLDGDTDLDLVGRRHVDCNPQGLAGVVVYFNDGAGFFTEIPGRVPQVTGGLVLAVADVDGDGDVDIGLESETLVNNGTGFFQSQGEPNIAGDQLLLVDFDGNGAAERVTARFSGVHVDGAPVHGGWHTMFRALTAADFDRDGDPDLAVLPHWNFGGLTPGDSNLTPTLLLNQRRQLTAPVLLRVGQDYLLELRATDTGTTAIAFVGLPRDPRLAIPGLGELGVLQPAVLPAVAIPDPDTATSIALPVPAEPVLVGIELASQALFLPQNPAAAHLSGVVRDYILP